jgi:hypothetical protein
MREETRESEWGSHSWCLGLACDDSAFRIADALSWIYLELCFGWPVKGFVSITEDKTCESLGAILMEIGTQYMRYCENWNGLNSSTYQEASAIRSNE